MKEWAHVIYTKYIQERYYLLRRIQDNMKIYTGKILFIEEDTGQYERVGPCYIYKIYTRNILFIEEDTVLRRMQDIMKEWAHVKYTKIYTGKILFIEEVEFGLYFAGAVLPTSHLKICHLRHVSKMWHYHIGYGQTLSFWAAHICCMC